MTYNSDILPDPPSFTKEEYEKFRKRGDFTPVLFEWYKFAAMLGVVISNIRPESPAFKNIPRIHYHITVGLLNRCHRLMLSNVALSHQGKFGETTSIIDRCIFESAIKLRWLCSDPETEKFNRYLAGGLKTEIEFKGQIERQVANSGYTDEIEARMLRSISRHIAVSSLNETEINATPDMPDMFSLMQKVGYDRLMYVVAQKIGSHHIHGTWSSLLMHYLEEDVGNREYPELTTFKPRGHDCDTHINQYMYVPVIFLDALSAYVDFTLQGNDEKVLKKLSADTKERILEVFFEAERVRDAYIRTKL